MDVMRSPACSPARAARPSADIVLMRHDGLWKLTGSGGRDQGRAWCRCVAFNLLVIIMHVSLSLLDTPGRLVQGM